MDAILELSEINYAYHTRQGETKALTDISFSVNPGEFTAIVGPSGCGKSTLLSLISGLIKPESGEITLYREPIDKSEITVGYMLQHDHLFEWRSVYRNILLGLEIQHRLNPATRRKAEELLAQYGLKNFKHAKPSALSGGMRQRAALIRTLVLEPELLLLDEPFSALDYQTRLSVSDDIGQIIRDSGKTALLVTHDLSEAVSLADRVIILSRRPASIVKILDISFDLEKDTPMERRNAPEFKNYFYTIWKELKAHE